MTETKLPTEEDLAGLPHLAIVAFAARCARRVQPVYQTAASNSFEEYVIESLDAALSMIERDAFQPSDRTEGDLPALLDIGNGGETFFTSNLTAMSAANTVFNASSTIEFRFERAKHQDMERSALRATAREGMERSAVRAAKNSLDAANSELTLRAIASDLALLREAATVEKWTDDTPVPPEFFGPLWPDGEPEGWPAPTETPTEPQVIEFSFALPPMPDTPEVRNALIDRIRAVLTKANAVHLAEGGSGLKITGAKVYSAARQPQEVDQ